MRPRRCTAVCLAVLLLPLSAPSQPMPPADISADELLLRDAGISTDGDALIRFFRQRTLSEKDAGRIEQHIKELAHRSFRVREAATAELIALGATSRSPLQEAAGSKDPEVAMRAQRCLKAIEQGHRPETLGAAARVIALRKPAGATVALLDYLPSADRTVREDVRRAITAVGVKDGNPDPVLLTALTDKLPEKRAAAAEALLRAGSKELKEKARKSLDDPNIGVRFLVAVALIEAHDKSGVEPLISMLPDLAQEDVWRAEAMLYPMAGEKAPQAAPGSRPEERRAYRDAWMAWWKANAAGVDLAKIAEGPRYLGRTLLLSMNRRAVGGPGGGPAARMLGSVTELGPDGKPRWSFTNVEYPIDAQSLGDDRILLAEYRARRVSERNSKGETLWSKEFNTFVMGAQRLPNGKTLVCTRSQVLEVDKQGNESVVHTGQMLTNARRLRNGHLVIVERNVTNAAGTTIVHLDAAGKEVSKFNVAGTSVAITHRFDILPNGNVLVPQYTQNKVVEYDSTGKAVWQATGERPTAAMRLPNGNTLITSYYSGLVRELTRDGTEVWKYQHPEPTSLISALRR